MIDSEARDTLDEKQEQVREQRLESIKRWIEFIEEHPSEVWGPQQNALINSQLKSARESGLDAEHFQRVRRAGCDRRDPVR